jgi:putative colanic acid biosynthesis acetyltransferase WcaF
MRSFVSCKVSGLTMDPQFDPAAFGQPAFTLGNRLRRGFWNVIYYLLFFPSPRPLHAWRRFILRRFGADVARGCHIYPKAVIWAPWNLSMGEGASIANGAEVYNPSAIRIDDYAVISQGAYLCGASHDYRQWSFPLVSGPITIGKHAWIAARAIVQMGIVIGDGCVIGAGSVVTKNMPPWTVCAGNPCHVIKNYERAEGLQVGAFLNPGTPVSGRRSFSMRRN